MMEIRQLRYFLMVAELKSFSRASANGHIAQPALSRHVRKLEEELGVKLFHRDGRGVSLSDSGEEFYNRVKVLIHQLEQVKADVQSLHDVATGEVTIGVPPQLGPAFIASLIKRFRGQYPSANIRVTEGFSFQVCEWLELGRIGVGIIYDPKSYNYISAEVIFQEDLFIVAPAGHPITSASICPFSNVISLPLIMPDRPSSLRNQVENAAIALKKHVNVCIGVDSIGAIKELVRDGYGFSIMPIAAVSQEVCRGELSVAKIVDPTITRPLVVALPPKGVLSASTRRLIALIREEVRNFVDNGRWSGTLFEETGKKGGGPSQG